MRQQPNDFAAQVTTIRQHLKLSQEELAQALGVSFATVNRWENAKTALAKLAQRQFEQFCHDKNQQGALPDE